MRNKKAVAGFTMMEMMVTLAIVGILSAIAYPSYIDSVRKSNRTEAKVEMLDIAQRLQRCYTTYGTYTSANCAVYQSLTTGASKIVSRGKGFYEIEISNNDATTYTLTATAVKTPQTEDAGCVDTMQLTHLGVQTPVDDIQTPADENCW